MKILFWGKVKKGQQRGKKLGFPTANLSAGKQIRINKIDEGIYVSKTKIRNKTYQSITFIGAAKTFSESTFQVETYILDFNKDIYYQWISVTLLKKLRGNKKFSSVQELIKQMKEDEREARIYFLKLK